MRVVVMAEVVEERSVRFVLSLTDVECRALSAVLCGLTSGQIAELVHAEGERYSVDGEASAREAVSRIWEALDALV